MSNRRPPVIPEIAKAYQNDPRTLLARAATATGTSTAPVAAGRYAYADGIARALQGALGGYIDRKMMDRYTHGDPNAADPGTLKPGSSPEQVAAWTAAQNQRGEDGLLALRAQRGADGITGATPQQANVAAALGAPAPPPQPPGPALGAPPAIPAAPPALPAAAPPPQPPGPPGLVSGDTPPAMGGGPTRRPPFGSAASGAPRGPLAPPVAEAIPDLPKVLERPNAPEAVGPTRSKLLDAAYRIMTDANPYESASGQDLYTSGLSDQDKLNEAAAERRQHITDMGYQSDLSQYADSQSQARGDTYQERRDAQSRNFQGEEAFKDKLFRADESAKERAKDFAITRMNNANALAVAKVREQTSAGGSTALTDDERAALSKAVGDGRIDLKGITKFQAKVVAQALIDNPNLDGVHLHAAAVLAANPAAQQKAMLVAAMPSVLANVRDAGKKIRFSDAQFIGKLQAWGKGQFNDPDFTAYMTQRNDAMQTLAQVMSGVGATDMRTKMESQAAPKTMSPRAWEAWYQGQMSALRPRIEMYEKRGLLPPGTTSSIDPEPTAPAAPSGGWGRARVVGQ